MENIDHSKFDEKYSQKNHLNTVENDLGEACDDIDYDLPENRYFNREISWLKFNTRVLEEASNQGHPLLERLRFLSISASNLDEFYSVRVAGLVALIQGNVNKIAMTGENPSKQLEKIYQVTNILLKQQQAVVKTLLQELSDHGITLLSYDNTNNVNDADKKFLKDLFYDQLFPVLTPLAIDPIHPFPFIPHQGLSLILLLKHQKSEEIIHIVIPIPMLVDRFYRLPTESDTSIRFVGVETIILMNLGKLLPDYIELGYGIFSVLRDTDLEVAEEAEDLVREFESALRRRRSGQVIRLKMTASIPIELSDIIKKQIDAHAGSAVFVENLIGLSSLSQMITDLRPDLLFKRYTPRLPERIRDFGGDIFKAIAEKDFIVHHPFESFDTVVNFIRQAAQDSDVVSIKATLYRTSSDSPIVAALIEAAENGKSVTVIVELKARFDEAANIRQARALEQAGVHVVYGLVGCKIHAKTTLIVRRENNKLVTYSHFGTGNYHPLTAKLYTDLSLFTCNDAFGRDASRFFNFVTGYVEPHNMEVLSIAPLTLKNKLLHHIFIETQNATQGLPAGIYAKMNSLVDPVIINALYKASQAGVKIYLNIRGVCCLRPGVVNLSENITVVSIVGRFLEHSRIVCFANGSEFPSDQSQVYISSADWMPRNLERRVELLIPIVNETVKKQLIYQVIPACFLDNTQTWQLISDGTYKRITPEQTGRPAFSAHNFFMENQSLSGKGRSPLQCNILSFNSLYV